MNTDSTPDDRAFDLFAEEGDDWLNDARERLLTFLLREYLPPPPHPTSPRELLEVGAASGRNLAAMAAFGVVDALELSARGRAAIEARGVARHVYKEPLPRPLARGLTPPRYDVIAALDVVEHIEDDGGALLWMRDHLRVGGHLVATVPAYPILFSDHDRALHHHRRYTRASFAALVPDGMRILTAGYFVHLLFPVAIAARGAWSLARHLAGGGPDRHRSPRRGLLARGMGAVLDLELALIERGYRPPFGLSVFAVARRER